MKTALYRLSTIAIIAFFSAFHSEAVLVAKLKAPKNTGSKVIVGLELENTYAQKVKAVRAAVFLLDDQGKMIGQDTAWIVGGAAEKLALEPSAKAAYNFVIAAQKPFSQTRLMITRIVLADGKLGNIQKDVQVQYPPKQN